MFCSNCGNRLEDGAKFCSACGSRVQDAAGQEFRFGGDTGFKEPKLDTGIVRGPEEKPAPARGSVSFDWSAVVDEPRKREIPDVKSPWATTGGIDEKELYAEMTPSTDRSRTMSFIDLLKAEKEEKEKKAEERAFVYTDVLEVDADMSSFNDAPTLNYAPLYDDVDAPVKTPFDNYDNDVERKADRRTSGDVKKPAVETSRETIAQFEEYVKSFEAGAGIVHDEPRFEKPEPARPVSDEPRFELPDFLKRAAAPSKEGPVFGSPADAAVSLEELSSNADIDFRKDIIDEPTFEVPKIEETEKEPVFEEPKYEEPAFEEPVFDEDGFEEGFSEYLDLDTTREEKPVDEDALFAEMEKSRPAKTGMTIAAPADEEAEVEALRKRLMELTGTEIRLDEIRKAAPENLTMETETTTDLDDYFDGLAAASETTKKEPAAVQPAEVNPEDLYLDSFPAAEAKPEPELLVLDKAEQEPAPAHAAEEPVMVVHGDLIHDTAPAPAPTPEPAPAPAAPEVKAEEHAPAHAAEEPVMVVHGDLIHDTAPAPAPTPETVSAPAATEVKAEEPAPAPAPAAPEVKEEEHAPAHAAEEPVMVVHGDLIHDTAPAPAPTPETVSAPEVKAEEPTPAPTAAEAKEEEHAPAHAAEEPVMVVQGDLIHDTAPALAPTPETVSASAAPEVKAEEPAPAPAEAPKEEKASDALSLEELEKDLFGETPTAEAQTEETKKIDKFYTLYRKNEEFQRLLDEEYDKLKGENPSADVKTEAPKTDGKDGAVNAAAAEIPAEQSKAYRQVEDETIYKAFDMPAEIVKAPPKEADAGSVKAQPAEVKADAAVPAKEGKKAGKEDKKAAREAAKAEKAKLRQEKKAAKAKAKADAADTSDEYEEVDKGSGFLTVLAVVIAIILVILLAVILILQVAPDSSIAFTIDSIISKFTGGYGAIDPGNGQFLL